MKILNSILIALLIGAGIFATVEIGLLVKDVRKSQANLVGSISKTIKDTDEAVLFARKTLLNINVMVARVKVDKFNETVDRQNTYWATIQKDSRKALENVNALTQSLNSLVVNTDRSINTGLLPEITAATGKLTSTVQNADTAIQEASDKANAGFDDIHRLMSDPSLKESQDSIASALRHIDYIAGDIDTATDSLPSIAADLEKISKTSQKFSKPLLIARIVSLMSWLIPWLH
jgi:hypothetical protein